MRSGWILLMAFVLLSVLEAYSAVTATPAPIAVSASATVPVVVNMPSASPAPVVPKAPMSVDASTAVQPVVVKDVDMAPPTWMQDVLVSVKTLPIIGPMITKAVQWLAVICSILTALCAFILLVLKALAGVSTLGNIQSLADKVAAFQNSKIFYYLKYASMFNAQKPPPRDQSNAA